jgi:citrate synthase
MPSDTTSCGLFAQPEKHVKQYYDVWPRKGHPMAYLSSIVSALSTYYEDSLDPFDPRQVEISVHRLLAKLPTIAAYA